MTTPGAAQQRDPFACSVVLRRFGLWRTAVAVLAAAALAALYGWGSAEHGDTESSAISWFAGCAGLAVVALSLLLFRVEGGTLRRDAGRWTFAPRAAGPADEPQGGDLVLALDFGIFMLLAFDRHDVALRPMRRWLPVQRQGLEREWQALRCAVHARRPMAAAATGAAGPPE